MKIRIIFDNNNPEALESTLILTKNIPYIIYSNLRKTMNAYDLPESPKTLLVSSSIQPIYFEIH